MEEETFYDSLEEPADTDYPEKIDHVNEEPISINEENKLSPENAEGDVSSIKNEILNEENQNQNDLKHKTSDAKCTSCLEISKRVKQVKNSQKRCQARNKFCNSYLEMYRAKKQGSEVVDISSYGTASSTSNTVNTVTCSENLTADELFFNNKESSHECESLYDCLSMDNKSILSNKFSFLTTKSPSKASFTCSISSFSSRPPTPSTEVGVNASSRNVQSKKSAKLLKIPELGGLGPNVVPEKMDSFRRRMSYGKSVSDKNRSKMEERKLLRNLQQEINECKNF